MSDHNYELYVEKKQARAEGLAEGRAEGLAEGRAEERADNLAVLQDMNLSPEQIAEFKARLEARGKQPVNKRQTSVYTKTPTPDGAGVFSSI